VTIHREAMTDFKLTILLNLHSKKTCKNRLTHNITTIQLIGFTEIYPSQVSLSVSRWGQSVNLCWWRTLMLASSESLCMLASSFLSGSNWVGSVGEVVSMSTRGRISVTLTLMRSSRLIANTPTLTFSRLRTIVDMLCSSSSTSSTSRCTQLSHSTTHDVHTPPAGVHNCHTLQPTMYTLHSQVYTTFTLYNSWRTHSTSRCTLLSHSSTHDVHTPLAGVHNCHTLQSTTYTLHQQVYTTVTLYNHHKHTPRVSLYNLVHTFWGSYAQFPVLNNIRT